MDGQETILVDSTSAPTYAWRLRYNSTLTKWEFVGGRPAFAEVVTSETTASTTYAALATAGPSIVLPVAGAYMVEIGGFLQDADGAVSVACSMSYDIGGTGAVDADRIHGEWAGFAGSLTIGSNHSRARVKTGLTAVTLTAKYKVSAGTGTFAERWMSVTPVTL